MYLADENSGPSIHSKLVRYIEKNGAGISFTQRFWKGCEPHPYESARYPLYAAVIKLGGKGLDAKAAAEALGVRVSSARRWIRFEQKPKLAHYLAAYLELGEPREGWVWLSVNNTSGHSIPLGPFVQVPTKLTDWLEAEDVLSQLQPLRETDSLLSKDYLFGFLLGMIIGDAAKSRVGTWHRHLGLVLSKKYDTNVKIGDFTSECAMSLGLRMHRASDQPRPVGKPFGFYQWVSQASPLIDWVFNVALGLRDGERTTYDPVRMNWALKAPREFRSGLVQGIAESDGSVSIASQTVEFWIGPNWDFFKKLLLTFGVRSFRNREALSVTKTQVKLLGKIPAFSPLLATARCERFIKLVLAKHIGHGQRLPREIREFVASIGTSMSVPAISESLLDKFGVVVSFETVQRWATKKA